VRRVAVLVAVLLAGGCWWAWQTLQGLPSGATLRAAMEQCQIGRSSGRDFALCPRRHAFDDFPKHVIQAAIASEDRAFYSHGGVQALSVAGAMARNVARSLAERRVVIRQGGSTITQQFARTILLDERPGFARKFAEILLAPQIEAIWSKHEIIAGYLNVVPHARGMNGLDAAARHFFGVEISRVTIAEAALLIGMLPAPNLRDPTVDQERAYAAGERVLERMHEQQMISAAQLKRASHELQARIHGGKLRRGHAEYERLEFRPYRDFVLDELAQRGVTQPDEYRLLTHMDARLQGWTVEQTFDIAGDHQAAGVFLRPSGELLAISGSRDYAENSFNRAFKSARSIGSTGKLFPMIAAHERPSLLRKKYSTQPLRDGAWPAEPNRRCAGNVALPYALAQSCNRPFTWLAQELGPGLTSVVKRFGLKAPDSPLLVPLGGIETSPLQLARAYASLANGGQMPKIRGLVALVARSGKVELAAAEPASISVMAPATAKALLADLRAPVESGTARASNSRHAMVHGKTGTSTSNHDAWFVGVTRDYVGTFWIGDDRPQTMPGVFGGGEPARAFARVTDAYYVWQANLKPPAAATAAVPHRDAVAVLQKWVPALQQLAQQHIDLLALMTALMLVGLWLRGVIRTLFRLRVAPETRAVRSGPNPKWTGSVTRSSTGR
jgi:penicillin-binding protein 1A